MRVSRKKALENIKSIHATVKKLTSMTDGKVKNGMLQMVCNILGQKVRIDLHDIEIANQLTEEEFIEYVGPKMYPSYYKDKGKDEKEKENEKPEDGIAVSRTTIENLGNVVVRILLKLDKIIEIEQKTLETMETIEKTLNNEGTEPQDGKREE